MPIKFTCSCGAKLTAKEAHIGRKTHCPECNTALWVPRRSTRRSSREAHIRFACTCGKRIRARPEKAGKKVGCPQCGEVHRVPVPEADSRPLREPAVPVPAGPQPDDGEEPDEEYALAPEPEDEQTGGRDEDDVGTADREGDGPESEVAEESDDGYALAPEPEHERAARHSRGGDAIEMNDEAEPSEPDEKVPAAPKPAEPVEPYDMGDDLALADDSSEELAATAEPKDSEDEEDADTPQKRSRERRSRSDDDDDHARPRPTKALKVKLDDPTKAECTSCAGLVEADALICTHCGLDFSTGAYVAMSRDLTQASRDMGDEGIRAADLTQYFSVTKPVDAAVAGIYQVLNGYLLYLPYAGLLAVAARLSGILAHHASEDAEAQLVLGIGFGLFILFAWSGFVGCVKDALFQRDFGIERFAYYGIIHFLRFGLSVLITVPLWVGWGYVFAKLWVWVMGLAINWMLKVLIGFSVFTLPAGVGLGLVFIPCLAVLEQTNPFDAALRGTKFAVRYAHKLVGLAVTLLLIGGVSTSVLTLFYTMARAMLWAVLPQLVYDTLNVLVLSVVAAGMSGETLASLMMLYLSHEEDNERLKRIQSKIKGPYCRVWPVYAAMVLATILPFLFGAWEASLGERGVLFNSEVLKGSPLQAMLGDEEEE